MSGRAVNGAPVAVPPDPTLDAAMEDLNEAVRRLGGALGRPCVRQVLNATWERSDPIVGRVAFLLVGLVCGVVISIGVQQLGRTSVVFPSTPRHYEVAPDTPFPVTPEEKGRPTVGR